MTVWEEVGWGAVGAATAFALGVTSRNPGNAALVSLVFGCVFVAVGAVFRFKGRWGLGPGFLGATHLGLLALASGTGLPLWAALVPVMVFAGGLLATLPPVMRVVSVPLLSLSLGAVGYSVGLMAAEDGPPPSFAVGLLGGTAAFGLASAALLPAFAQARTALLAVAMACGGVCALVGLAEFFGGHPVMAAVSTGLGLLWLGTSGWLTFRHDPAWLGRLRSARTRTPSG